jgi:hypothetical protein
LADVRTLAHGSGLDVFDVELQFGGMMSAFRTINSIVAGTALIASAATVAGAQQRELFQWSGSVDQEVQITMNGRNVTASNIGPSEPGQRRANLISALPRTDGQVTVQVVNGRGAVDVISQPTAQNGYTARIRVRDPQGGASNYRLNVYWQAVSGGEVGPAYGRDRDNRGALGGGQRALQWSGDVDDNLLITLRPGGVAYRTVRGSDPRGIQSSFRGMPTNVTGVTVSVREGRGSVDVVQQPSAANGYTALIRVRDPQSGFGHYNFDVMWQ